MDFTFDEEQRAIQESADGIFAGLVTPDRVQAVEASEDRVDRELWAELARADLLGLVVPEALGGGGYGMVELSLILEGQGRSVAPVPLWATLALGGDAHRRVRIGRAGRTSPARCGGRRHHPHRGTGRRGR